MDNIEQQILDKGLNAPRVTPSDLQANIAAVYFFTAQEGVFGEAAYNSDSEARVSDVVYEDGTAEDNSLALLTLCVIVLNNGFTVTGESACASPENFDRDVGRQIARQNAEQKIWPLMGYVLKQKLAGV